MIVVYSNGSEVLVCNSGKSEKVLLRDYFTKGGRSLDDYDRTVSNGVVEIEVKALVGGDQIIGRKKG